MDETANRRWQMYISLLLDPEEKQVVFWTEGRGTNTVEKFVRKLGGHGGLAPTGREVCCDKLLASIAGVRERLP